MWTFLSSLISPVIGGISDYITYRKAKIYTKREVELKQLEKQGDLDVQTLNNHKDSFKDEWITAVVTIPWVLTFVIGLCFPEYLPQVKNAWLVIQEVVPVWFSNLFTALSMAIVGGRMFEKYLFRK